MNIFFRASNIVSYKDTLRRHVRFIPLLTNTFRQRNFISATANDASIDSTLNSICYAYKFDRKIEPNKFYSKNVEFVYQYSPNLILVPQTYGELYYIEPYLSDIFSRIENSESSNIHFTHYSLITQNFPLEELTIFLSFLLKKSINVNNIFIDIDDLYLTKVIDLYKELTLKIKGIRFNSTQNLLLPV